MGRFNEKSYDPRKESSPGKKVKGKLVLRVQEGQCHCGCGEKKSEKALFRMGHDARLRGKLIRAHLTDTPVVLVDEAQPSPVSTAYDLAKKYSWTQYLEAAGARREGKNRQVLNSALNSKRLIKVGRWEHTGQVVAIFEIEGNGEEYEVEYVTKMGETRKARVPANQTKAVR